MKDLSTNAPYILTCLSIGHRGQRDGRGGGAGGLSFVTSWWQIAWKMEESEGVEWEISIPIGT